MATRKDKYPGCIEIDGEPSEYPTVLWFDPGGVTGWAVFTVHPDSLIDPDCNVIENIEHKSWGQIAGAGKEDESENVAFAQALGVVQAWPGAAIGTEDFTLRQFTKDSELLTPVRFNKLLSYTVWAGGYGPVWKQQPSLAKRTATDIRLKGWNLYDTHSGGHARDAIRHCLTFLRRCKTDSALRALAWPDFYEPA